MPSQGSVWDRVFGQIQNQSVMVNKIILLRFMLCNLVAVSEMTCGPIADLENGQNSCSNSDKFASLCSFQCESGFQLVGLDAITCLKTQKWSGTTPFCTSTCRKHAQLFRYIFVVF